MKVSKGLLGEENSSLIGSMIITKIYQAAMARANIKEEDRTNFKKTVLSLPTINY